MVYGYHSKIVDWTYSFFFQYSTETISSRFECFTFTRFIHQKCFIFCSSRNTLCSTWKVISLFFFLLSSFLFVKKTYWLSLSLVFRPSIEIFLPSKDLHSGKFSFFCIVMNFLFSFTFRYEQARWDFEAAIRLDRTLAPVHVNIGVLDLKASLTEM